MVYNSDIHEINVSTIIESRVASFFEYFYPYKVGIIDNLLKMSHENMINSNQTQEPSNNGKEDELKT